MTHAYTTDDEEEPVEEIVPWPSEPQEILACRARMGMAVDGVPGDELEAQPDSDEVRDLIDQIEATVHDPARVAASDRSCPGAIVSLVQFREHLRQFV